MKKILLAVCLIMLFAGSAFADYTIEVKNEGGTVIGSKVVTSLEVTHLQKRAATEEVSALTYFWNSIDGVIRNARAANRAKWIIENDAYIEEHATD